MLVDFAVLLLTLQLFRLPESPDFLISALIHSLNICVFIFLLHTASISITFLLLCVYVIIGMKYQGKILSC